MSGSKSGRSCGASAVRAWAFTPRKTTSAVPIARRYPPSPDRQPVRLTSGVCNFVQRIWVSPGWTRDPPIRSETRRCLSIDLPALFSWRHQMGSPWLPPSGVRRRLVSKLNSGGTALVSTFLPCRCIGDRRRNGIAWWVERSALSGDRRRLRHHRQRQGRRHRAAINADGSDLISDLSAAPTRTSATTSRSIPAVTSSCWLHVSADFPRRRRLRSRLERRPLIFWASPSSPRCTRRDATAFSEPPPPPPSSVRVQVRGFSSRFGVQRVRGSSGSGFGVRLDRIENCANREPRTGNGEPRTTNHEPANPEPRTQN